MVKTGRDEQRTAQRKIGDPVRIAALSERSSDPARVAGKPGPGKGRGEQAEGSLPDRSLPSSPRWRGATYRSRRGSRDSSLLLAPDFPREFRRRKLSPTRHAEPSNFPCKSMKTIRVATLYSTLEMDPPTAPNPMPPANKISGTKIQRRPLCCSARRRRRSESRSCIHDSMIREEANEGRSVAPVEREDETGKSSRKRFLWFENWWTAGDSNPRPPRCERDALPTELAAHF